MNVIYCPALPIACSSSSSCSSFARYANGCSPSQTGRCVLSSTPLGFTSSLFQLANRHRRHVCSQKLLLVNTRRSAYHLHGDRWSLPKTFARAQEDRASKFGVSGAPDGVDIWVPQKEEYKISCVEARDFGSSATQHTASEPLSQQIPFSPPQNFPTNSNLTRKQQTRVVNPSAASRLQNRLPAFKQAAEPDAFGASFSPLDGADAFSSCNGQGPSTSGPSTPKSSREECSSPKESVFTSKLEEILNKFRTSQKRSSFRDEPYDVGRRNRGAPSDPQSGTLVNERLQARRSNAGRSRADGDQRKIRRYARNLRRVESVSETSVNENDFNEEEFLFSSACHRGDSLRERRLGMTKGNGVGLYNAENSIPNLVEGSTPLQWERQGVHSPVSKLQTSIRKGNSNPADVHAMKSSQSVMFDKNRRRPGLDSHDDGHWSTGVEKPREIGEGEHHPDAKENVVSEFHWTDSDEGNNFDTDASITPDDGAISTHGRKDDQPSPGSSMGVKTSKFRTIMNGKIATWHSHSYPNLPFEFEYSYSENPKAPIVRYREEPYSPFGPDTMGRPWTGCAPLKKSRKKLPEFDSFEPLPAKKGIKFVQSPGPFPEGRGPVPARSREDILGAPLTVEEIVDLVDKCRSEKRQLNLGRDGVTHNMLNLIHCHWKRRRVVKVKCIGVPTVDMDNVCFHLEDKTGGKIIYRSGGLMYLFRGRNYNYKHRPIIPIMLWKPISPVYPRLIKRAPEGLTHEEADKLRLMGQKVEPLCTLAKNGVYLSLVKDVRAAFKVDDLVRINCRGFNPSDYKKIGAKLRDLVPCVLLSFDNEQILMWRGKETVSANVDAGVSNRMEAANGSAVEAAKPSGACNVGDDESHSAMEKMEQQALVTDSRSASMGSSNYSIAAGAEGHSDHSTGVETIDQTRVPSTLRTVLDDNTGPIPEYNRPNDKTFDIVPEHETENNTASDCQFSESRRLMESNSSSDDQKVEQTVPKMALNLTQLESSREIGTGWKSLSNAPVVGVDALWDQAIASGIAIQLDEIETDSDVIAKKADEIHKTVPAVPEYTRKLLSKLWIKKKTSPRPDDDLRILFKNLSKLKNEQKAAKRGSRSSAIAVRDSGGLPMDELARILSIK